MCAIDSSEDREFHTLLVNPSTNELDLRASIDFTPSLSLAVYLDDVLDEQTTRGRYHDVAASTLLTHYTLRPWTAGHTANYRY